jgi:hypothetical protein
MEIVDYGLDCLGFASGRGGQSEDTEMGIFAHEEPYDAAVCCNMAVCKDRPGKAATT